MNVVKGHGTENDFVVIADLDAELDLTPDLVRAICDRHSGIGADGILRVVRAEAHADAAGQAAGYFMDYRNADGSVAEMCGNGVRVFVRYLIGAGLVDGDLHPVATRAGVRMTWVEADGQITVDMGVPELLTAAPEVHVPGLTGPARGIAVAMPNPHVVVELATGAQLAALDLAQPPSVDPPLPQGQNVEFIVRAGERHLQLRVHERGVGETRSCGTGIAASVVAASLDDTGSDGVWQVDVPGGTCLVRRGVGGTVLLTGPAVLVADVQLRPEWLAALSGSRAVPSA